NSAVKRALCGLCIPVIVIFLDFFAAFKYKYESDHCNSSPLPFSTIFIVVGCIGIANLVVMSAFLYGALLVANRDMIKANLYQVQGRKEESEAAFERGQVLVTKGMRLNMALACPWLLLVLFSIAWTITSWVSYANSISPLEIEQENCKLPQKWWIGLFVAVIVMNMCSGQRNKKADKCDVRMLFDCCSVYAAPLPDCPSIAALDIAKSKRLGGLTNYFKDYFKAPMDKVKNQVVDEAIRSRANVVIPDTASDFKATTAMVSKLLAAGYSLRFMAVFADKEVCESRGSSRESEEGKKSQPL
ncbi:unnamed protein product, partial [Polarella glacialis]